MKEIQTNGIEVLFVEVPEDAKEFDVHHNVLLCFHLNDNVEGINLPIGQYQILGKSTELSEEQMREIVEPAKHSSLECSIDPKDDTYIKSIDFYNRPRWTKITSTFYKDYAAKQKPRSMTWLGEVKTIQESYLSLLEANGIVDRNTIEKPKDKNITYNNLPLYLDYKEAQSKVKHYLVLKRI